MNIGEADFLEQRPLALSPPMPIFGLIGSAIGGGLSGLFGGGAKKKQAQEQARYIREGAAQLDPYTARGEAAGGFMDQLLGIAPGTEGGEALERFRELSGTSADLRGAQRSAAGGLAAKGLLESSGAGKIFQGQAADIQRGSFKDFLAQLFQTMQAGQTAATNKGNLLAAQPASAGMKTQGLISGLFG